MFFSWAWLWQSFRWLNSGPPILPNRGNDRWVRDDRWPAIRQRLRLYQCRRLRRHPIWTPFDGRNGMAP